MTLQETIRKVLRETSVPKSERVQLYKDENIIVVVPLTHSALQKYAQKCQWCINNDRGEWESYHQGVSAVIIQRKPKINVIGITGNPTASEIYFMSRWDNGNWDIENVEEALNYQFKSERSVSNYYMSISTDINNFATNIVYYSPEHGVYDMEDNLIGDYHFNISDIPNVTNEVINIMDDYLKKQLSVMNEGVDDKIINMVNSLGIITASKFVGGYDKLFNMLGDYELTRDMKIRLIKEFIVNESEDRGMGVIELTDEDIPFEAHGEYLHAIEYLYGDSVVVRIWGDDYDTDEGNYHVSYEELPENIINEIFSIIMTELIKNNEYN
jgi:hypothetical protein